MRKGNVITRAAYIEITHEAERTKREAKKQAWEKIGDELEQDMQVTRKLIYSITEARNYKKGKEPTARTIKNKEGTLLTEHEEINERWREYFSDLLGTNEEMQHQEPSGEEMTYKEDVGDVVENNISREEINLALKEIKNGKSPECEEIQAELLTGSEDMIAWLHIVSTSLDGRESIQGMG